MSRKGKLDLEKIKKDLEARQRVDLLRFGQLWQGAYQTLDDGAASPADLEALRDLHNRLRAALASRRPN
jgi:hypothetical protein